MQPTIGPNEVDCSSTFTDEPEGLALIIVSALLVIAIIVCLFVIIFCIQKQRSSFMGCIPELLKKSKEDKDYERMVNLVSIINKVALVCREDAKYRKVLEKFALDIHTAAYKLNCKTEEQAFDCGENSSELSPMSKSSDNVN